MNRTEYKNQHAKEHYDLASGESRFGKKKQGFNEEQRSMLEKWQVPQKYYEMIENMSYTKDEGYFIYLKEGYVNDATGSFITLHIRV